MDAKYTGKLAREIRKGLKTIGAVNVFQTYKGTGKRAAGRQLWCKFDNGAVIDLWLGRDNKVQLGGVVWYGGKGPRIDVYDGGTDAVETAQNVVKAVRIWKDGE